MSLPTRPGAAGPQRHSVWRQQQGMAVAASLLDSPASVLPREKDSGKEKERKVRRTIPAWATLSASQLARAQKQTQMAASSRPKMDAILIEAIKASAGQAASPPPRWAGCLADLLLLSQACYQKGGASVVAIRKYIIGKYASLELERRGYLLKQALKRELERGVIRQVSSRQVLGCCPGTRTPCRALGVGGVAPHLA